MENDVAAYAVGYVLARLAALAAFGFLIYQVLRPVRAVAGGPARADRVPEDRC